MAISESTTSWSDSATRNRSAWRRRRSAPGRPASSVPTTRQVLVDRNSRTSRPSGPGARGCRPAPPALAERRGQLAAQDVQRRPVGRRGRRRRALAGTRRSSAGGPPLTARRPARERVSHAPPASSASSGDCSNCCTSASASLDVGVGPLGVAAEPEQGLGGPGRHRACGSTAGRSGRRRHVRRAAPGSRASTQVSLPMPRPALDGPCSSSLGATREHARRAWRRTRRRLATTMRAEDYAPGHQAVAVTSGRCPGRDGWATNRSGRARSGARSRSRPRRRQRRQHRGGADRPVGGSTMGASRSASDVLAAAVVAAPQRRHAGSGAARRAAPRRSRGR